jgi:iron-sulfur cluster repair protein YtfE (RIC family)
MTPPSTPASRRFEVLDAWDGELRLHFAIEEENLFPAVREATNDPATHALLDRLLADHRRLADLRDTVAAADPATLDAGLRAFADLLEAHVRTEERELFASFPGSMSAATAEQLTRIIHQRRPPDGTHA